MRFYKRDYIKLIKNQKTKEVATIDIAKGCKGCELKHAPCYAFKMARMSGLDFFTPVPQKLKISLLEKQLQKYNLDWIRIGCISDPSLNWEITSQICRLASEKNITPVIISKIYSALSQETLESLVRDKAQLQVSTSGLMSRRQKDQRLSTIINYKKLGGKIVNRINSAVFKENSKAYKLQENLILFSQQEEIPILETPLRTFKTSPLYSLLDSRRYKKHLSPLSGKYDSQSSAGLIIPNTYACYSTCSPTPIGNYDPGCSHQCCTKL